MELLSSYCFFQSNCFIVCDKGNLFCRRSSLRLNCLTLHPVLPIADIYPVCCLEKKCLLLPLAERCIIIIRETCCQDPPTPLQSCFISTCLASINTPGNTLCHPHNHMDLCMCIWLQDTLLLKQFTYFNNIKMLQ